MLSGRILWRFERISMSRSGLKEIRVKNIDFSESYIDFKKKSEKNPGFTCLGFACRASIRVYMPDHGEKKSPSAGNFPDLLFLPYENRIYAEISSIFFAFGKNRIYAEAYICRCTPVCLIL